MTDVIDLKKLISREKCARCGTSLKYRFITDDYNFNSITILYKCFECMVLMREIIKLDKNPSIYYHAHGLYGDYELNMRNNINENHI